jgi:glycosyltransferase involved in cell wall biosynthesis
MRIVVVSAHFPPSFVSGGTLVPQRLARGLRDRGHDVSVYAGWLGDRPPLSAWEETDETGLPVRWIVTTPWIDWADPRCYDNPPVADDFAAHLRARRPDVVHLHSLQSLGGDLVRVAHESGARVVVTAHDFWWSCARQFLADRSMRPCPIVVACGDCQCEVDRAFLEERDAWLAARLALADVVLARSASAAAVLRANGVAGVEVDENGMVDDRPHAVSRARGDTVRFLYTGGPEQLKGAAVLAAAARQIGPRPGWHLTAYGLDALDGLPVSTPEAYAPAEIDEVFTHADVLVVPSVARESHSLVTREGLLRGLPVICTDTLGPEEVVVDGVNGYVVRAGDADDLAAAMGRLIDEPDLVERLTPGPVRTRSLTAQLDELEQRFEALVVTPRATPPPPINRVLFVSGIEGAPLRYRARLPAEALALHGVATDVRHFFDPELPALVEQADVVVLYRVPATDQILTLVARARERGAPVLFDVDDLIFDPDVASEIPALSLLEPTVAAAWLVGVHRYRTTLEACDGFIGSTPLLAEHARAVTGLPTAVFENGVGIVAARRAEREVARARRPGPLRIGYFSGTDTHDHDWQMIEPAVIDVLDARPDVELWLGGLLPPTPALDRFGSRVQRRGMVPWLELVGVLRDLDVNLAPLVTATRFNHAKSAIKWLEAALVATPSVASPTDPFVAAVDDGRTGLLAEGHDAWVAAMLRLLDDDHGRDRMGQQARRAALLGWAPALQGRRYLRILHDAAAWATQPRPSSSWPPVSVDEQPRVHVLEPYGDGDQKRLERERERAERRARAAVNRERIRRSVADDGFVATARRAARALGRKLRGR